MESVARPSFSGNLKSIFLTDKYSDFEGRARRAEYWKFWLFHVLVSGILVSLDVLIDVAPESFDLFRALLVLYGLAVIIPLISVAVRRLHDTNRSGWYLLLPAGLLVIGWTLTNWIDGSGLLLLVIIPNVASLLVLLLLTLDSDQADNDYGVSPKYVRSA